VRRAGLAAIACAAAALVPPAPAPASTAQLTMLEDPTQLVFSGPEARERALDEVHALGAQIVKVRVEWRLIAPDAGSETPPAFDASDPGAYPPGAWDAIDGVVLGAVRRGLRPFLMLSPPAPEWATEPGERAGHYGVRKPDPVAFARFVEAAGRRYSGTYGGLPRVVMWSFWNEPNHPQFIQPLSERLGGRMTPSSPHRYRELYLAGQGALAASGHARDIVLFGEILPIGQRRLGELNTLSPLLFLREMFCLDRRYRPLRGGAARARGCPARFPRIRTSGFAYHAYTRPTGPRTPLPNPDDATIGQIQRVERALDRIAATGRLRRGLPIHNTEFGVQTEPPDCVGFGASLAEQAAFINEAEYVSYTRRRVKSYSNYLLVDDPIRLEHPPGSNERYRGFQSGLRFGENALRCDSPTSRFEHGEEKSPGYAAFRTPIWVRDLGRRRGVEVWGAARPRGRAQQQIEILRGGVVLARQGARGYFVRRLRTSARGAWQLRWTVDGETYVSRVARATRDPRPNEL
jgi:hypothetical protein